MTIEGVLTVGLPRVTGVSLNRILWAYRTGQLPEPARLGCHRVHSPEDVRRIIEHFRVVDEERRLAREKTGGQPKRAGGCGEVAEGAGEEGPVPRPGQVVPGEVDYARRA